MNTVSNITDLASYRNRAMGTLSEQELVDDISARAFMFLRDEADALGVSIPTLLAEHLLGIALVVEAVEGTAAAKALLSAASRKLGDQEA